MPQLCNKCKADYAVRDDGTCYECGPRTKAPAKEPGARCLRDEGCCWGANHALKLALASAEALKDTALNERDHYTTMWAQEKGDADRLRRENEGMREVLVFYADREKFVNRTSAPFHDYQVITDGGQRAREALAAVGMKGAKS